MYMVISVLAMDFQGQCLCICARNRNNGRMWNKDYIKSFTRNVWLGKFYFLEEYRISDGIIYIISHNFTVLNLCVLTSSPDY